MKKDDYRLIQTNFEHGRTLTNKKNTTQPPLVATLDRFSHKERNQQRKPAHHHPLP